MLKAFLTGQRSTHGPLTALAPQPGGVPTRPKGTIPESCLTRGNQHLIGLESDLFASCCCAWFDPDTGWPRWPPPGIHRL
jgi:hypothetical protein